MTSYLRRLAAAHGVLVSRLIRYEIMPLCRETRTKNMFLGRSSRSLHSTSDLAKEVVWALQRLTGQLNLTFSTLLPWVDLMVIQDVLRPTRTWCCACLEEQRQADNPVAEPLLWALQPIQICPKHQQLLQTACPHCQQTLPWLAAYARPGYCSACYAWLGIAPEPVTLSWSSLGEPERHWQQWLVEAVGNLLAAGPNLSSLPRLEWLATGLANYCAQVANGDIGQFSEILKLHQLDIHPNRLKDWLMGKNRPPFVTFFELCYCLRVEPLNLLTDETAVREPLPLRHLDFDRPLLKTKRPPPAPEKVAQMLEEILTQNDEPPLSLNQIAKQLGLTNSNFISKYFPEQATLIKQRYQAYTQAKQAQRRQKIHQEVRQAVFDIYDQGRDPTLGRLGSYVGKPKYTMNLDVWTAWKEARCELGLED
jgi:hypothetical protein